MLNEKLKNLEEASSKKSTFSRSHFEIDDTQSNPYREGKTLTPIANVRNGYNNFGRGIFQVKLTAKGSALMFTLKTMRTILLIWRCKFLIPVISSRELVIIRG